MQTQYKEKLWENYGDLQKKWQPALPLPLSDHHIAAPIIIYALTYFLAPAGVSCFTDNFSPVFPLAVSEMRIYGLGFLFSGINIYAAVRMMAYGKGYFSGLITFLRSFALLLLFLTVLPRIFGLTGVWLAVPAAEALTLLVSVWFLRSIRPQKGTVVP